MKIIIEEHDGFHKSDPSTRMDMLLMALKRAGYQLRGKPMPSWGCEATTLLAPYQCGNNWVPIIVGCAFSREPEVASPQEPNPYPEGSAAHYAFEHCVDPKSPQKTIMCMESGNTPGNPEPSSARMCMDELIDAHKARWSDQEVNQSLEDWKAPTETGSQGVNRLTCCQRCGVHGPIVAHLTHAGKPLGRVCQSCHDQVLGGGQAW